MWFLGFMFQLCNGFICAVIGVPYVDEMKNLIISRSFPSDFHTKVHGAYQRLRIFVEGAKAIASIDMLFYVSPALDVDLSFVSNVQRSFFQHWNVELNLYLCPMARPQAMRTMKERLLACAVGSVSFYRQSGYVEVSGIQHVEALETCLHHKPDAILIDRLHGMCPVLLTKMGLRGIEWVE
jgi:hypothetical protein